jgi:hypothetical protein
MNRRSRFQVFQHCDLTAAYLALMSTTLLTLTVGAHLL